MKSLMLLWREAAVELAAWCCTSTALDYKKLSARVEHEGDSFLTITLPGFGKDFERSLELGQVAPDLFSGFTRRGGLPLFLGGFLERVFDRQSGRLLDVPDVDSIFAIRQLTLMFGKILLPCSDARVRGAIEQYVECEKDLEDREKSIPESSLREFQRVSGLLFSDVFTAMDRKIRSGDIVGRHGPGATADRLFGNGKFDLREWTERLEYVFPFGEHATASWRYYYLYDDVQIHEPEAERPVRVITVPKTLKSPRIIAIEPTCMQFMQQAISQPLVEMLESPFIAEGAHRVKNTVCGFLGFSDQNPNQVLAQAGSMEGTLATLDLSEASDRVLNSHVELLTARWPDLSLAIQATRSLKANVPGHGVIPLTKYASMGSALCFPVEAMVFLTIIFMGIQDGLSRQLTKGDILSFLGRVRVYGDDLIVPVEFVRSVISRLTAFGHKVNGNKSFWNGKFRESCGKEYYNGHEVTITRVRRVFPRSSADAQEVISLVSLRNQFYSAGMWRTAMYLDKRLEGTLRYYPVVEDTSPALGRVSIPFSPQAERIDADLQKPLVRAFVQVSRPPRSTVSGEGALVKCLSPGRVEPFQDPEHLVRQGRPLAVDIKPRWVAPY